ncbi:hypothetical protein [uncultured Sulfitobacter sp.]|uniref:hypothetical protein n=1 Tax=uncultured Sulfitobacter sp. TaxID=191468 RepID=UPI00261CBBC9|nr:hypothetical protein [uncultured Sulfitobacter sp.]
MTEYVVQYLPSPALLEAGMRSINAPDGQKEPGRKNSIGKAVLWAALLVTVFLLFNLRIIVFSSDFIDPTILGFTALGFCAGFLVINGIYKRQTRAIVKLALDAAERHGSFRLVFRPEQIEISSALSHSTMNWLGVDRIVGLSDATVLQSGGGVNVVPDTALPEGVTPAQFRTDLQKWMEAAR